MKIRNGFVSNSSSSSFVLAFNGNKKDLEKKIDEIFGVTPENYPIKNSFKGWGKTFVAACENGEEYKGVKGIKEYCEEYGLEDETEIDDIILSYLKKDWTVYTGGFGDDCGDSIDAYLCNAEIKWSDDELFIEQEGGY